MPTKRRTFVAAASGMNHRNQHHEISTHPTSVVESTADPKRKKRKLGLKAAKKNHNAKLIIDLSDVPPQPLIPKNELSQNGYKDNTRRRPVKEGVSSKYTGVYYLPNGKWKAQIMADGSVRSLGYWETEEEAAAIYARAAFKYKDKGHRLHGGMDLSNIPEQPLIRSETVASGYKGVKKMRGRFQARVRRAGRSVTLGTFDTAEEAAGIHARALYYLEHEGGSEHPTATVSQYEGSRVGNAATDHSNNYKSDEGNPDDLPANGLRRDQTAADERDVKVVAV